jgi:hypothetical protein
MIDVQIFRGVDWYSCIVVAQVQERLSESKWSTQNFNMESFNLKKLNDAEVKE